MCIRDRIKSVQQEILYYGPIQQALDDPAVTNIDVNTPRDVYIERNGEEEYRPDLAFKDEDHLYNIINKMLIPLGKTLTANEDVYKRQVLNCLTTIRGITAPG